MNLEEIKKCLDKFIINCKAKSNSSHEDNMGSHKSISYYDNNEMQIAAFVYNDNSKDSVIEDSCIEPLIRGDDVCIELWIRNNVMMISEFNLACSVMDLI